MQLTIAEAAKKLHVSIHTLRYYEKEGLLPSITRNKSGSRIYTDSDIQWIYMIRCLRETDLPIRSIKEYVTLFRKGPKTLHERKEIIISYKAYTEKKIKTMQMTLAMIDQKLEYYEEMTSELKEVNQNKELNCIDYSNEWKQFKKYGRTMQHE